MNLDPRQRRIRDEMRHHLEELEAQLLSEGLDPDEARREARRRFGDPKRFQDDVRPPVGRSTWLGAAELLLQDAQYALRQMVRQRSMTLLTIGTLVVGVAATAVVFSVVHAVVLAPLPFHEPDGIVHVSQTSPQGREYSVSEPNFVDFAARQGSFQAMAAMGWTTPILSGVGPAESVSGLRVTHRFFDILGTPVVLGRTFDPEEDRFGTERRVVLLSTGAWARRFGSSPDIVGRTLLLDGTAHEVIGVVESVQTWDGVDVFTPLAPNPDEFRDDQRLEAVARLREGVTLEDAANDLDVIAAALSDEYPESNDGWGAQVQPVREWLIRPELQRLGALLMGSVALFLLMTCASLSNLLLARATARVGEVSVRTALGASAGRLRTQLLVEGAMVAFVASGLAVLLSFQGLALIQAIGPADVARLADATIDLRVLAIAILASVTTVFVAGVVPALVLSHSDGTLALRAARAGGSSRARRFRGALVSAQFALTVAVLIGAGLLTRSFVELQDVDMGFEATQLVRFEVRLPSSRFDQPARGDHLERLAAEIGAIPGVESVGAVTVPPFSAMRPSNFVARSDAEPARQQDFQPVSWRAVSGAYFAAAGIELRSGRVFGAQDRPRPDERVQNPPIIIDETLAETLFPGEDPVGRLLTWFLPGGRQCLIVGVVANARDERIDAVPRPRVYRPFEYTFWDQPTVLVRASGPTAALIPTLREAAIRVDADVPAISPTPVLSDVRDTLAWPRVSMIVLGIFGFVAVALAAMGVYGVTAFNVARRRREIGVRVALGAEPSTVRWIVLRQALRLAGFGIALGCAGGWVFAGLLGAFLYDVSTRDPVVFVAVPVALAVVAIFATWIPSQRALRLQPRDALLAE